MWGCEFGLLLGRRGEQAAGCQELEFVVILVQEVMEDDGWAGHRLCPKKFPLRQGPKLVEEGAGKGEKQVEGREVADDEAADQGLEVAG